jgi:hypothetical protein
MPSRALFSSLAISSVPVLGLRFEMLSRTSCRRSVLLRRQASRTSSRGVAPYIMLVNLPLLLSGSRLLYLISHFGEFNVLRRFGILGPELKSKLMDLKGYTQVDQAG